VLSFVFRRHVHEVPRTPTPPAAGEAFSRVAPWPHRPACRSAAAGASTCVSGILSDRNNHVIFAKSHTSQEGWKEGDT
jgi:hypothetical protein